jgi:4,5-DOPA dioxygenase extradiol
MRQVSLFIGHGSPMNALEDNVYTREWKSLGKYKPKAILAISAHWETEGLKVQSTKNPIKINDMYGFPQALYDLDYPVEGCSWLTDRVLELVDATVDDSWGIDHGIWSILVHAYPGADIPVVQLSLNKAFSLEQHLELAKSLRILRDEGVMILASGNIVHSFKGMSSSTEVHEWAITFDDSVEHALMTHSLDKLINYQNLPGGKKSVPTIEHFLPILYFAGTLYEEEKIEVFNKGYVMASFSMTSYVSDM